MRGEQLPMARKRYGKVGSPPLARGTDRVAYLRDSKVRITPACAGNSSGYSFAYLIFRDHPRLRGEQLIRCNNTSKIKGSPPLARGTAKMQDYIIKAFRITPACAGNSYRSQLAASGYGDHPRLRGEQCSTSCMRLITQGSPPLARGTGQWQTGNGCGNGITPACAGNRLLICTRS